MYRVPEKNFWKGREDVIDGSYGLRWHQKVRLYSLLDKEKITTQNTTETTFALMGFASDEGVRRNQGRTGASEAPNVLRSYLANLPWHFEDINLCDMGNMFCLGEFLEDAHTDLAEGVSFLLEKNCRTILLGGGHEIAYGHYLGLKNHLIAKNTRLGVINFDAHFDMRESWENKATSGTPFLQIARDLEKHEKTFNYMVLGVQKQSNTPRLYQMAKQWGVDYIEAEDLQTNEPNEIILQKIQNFIDKQDIIYLSICLDVFSAAYAPGVSAPNAMGLSPWIVAKLIKKIAQSGKVIALDIAELNPTYDIDGQTARLAANLVFIYVDACSKINIS
ncbi:MAG: formimidoylglutamase [Thermonemataceae bacterium]|nr:formimidoylglutamase [Thermonemataceae bacterium]